MSTDTQNGFRSGLGGKAALAWVLRMAWRDSRGKRRLLLLFTLSIVFGVGALVAINSFRDNLENTLAERSKTLLGADLALSVRRPWTPELNRFAEDLGGTRTREVRFRSMAYFPGHDHTRLVQVRAYDGPFPFYGELETQPADAAFLDQPKPTALVDGNLLRQFGVEVGETVRLGTKTFKVAGALERVAGESEVGSVFAPRVFIDRAELEGTGLVGYGSIARHTVFFRFEDGYTEAMQERIEAAEAGLLGSENVDIDTVEGRKRSVDRVLSNLYDFLNLVGFVALLLGAVGVAGAVQVYLKAKTEAFAVMRCIGAPLRYAFAIYLVQVLVVGLAGAILGAALGVGVQFFLPALLKTFLPFAVEITFSLGSVLFSLVFGWLVAVLFAFLPLLPLRRVSPLRALRADFSRPVQWWRDRLLLLVLAIIGAFVLGFCLMQTSDWLYGLWFFGGLVGALGLLALVAVGLRALVRRLARRVPSYPARLALGNLYRPQNRTVYLLVTLGMGAFLIHTLFLARGMVLERVEVQRTGDDPNLVLVDIQPDQVEGVAKLVEARGFSHKDAIPVVTMRPSAINGRPIEELRSDPESGVKDWVYTWEFRVTYREAVLPNETIVEGEWTPRAEEEPLPISLTPNISGDLNVKVGDTVTWNVQGVPVRTVVGSVRDVDWSLSRLNFGVVFPAGAIEAAPSFYALLVKTADRDESLALQQATVEAFPNVSAVDLTQLFEAIAEILDQAAFVVRFMAAFTIATGLIVLLAAMVTSRYQRVRESVLLRTLGASSAFVRRVMNLEYLLLGALAGLAGAILANVAAWALAVWVFNLEFEFQPLPTLIAVVTVALLTLSAGLFLGRGIASAPPLQILRDEG